MINLFLIIERIHLLADILTVNTQLEKNNHLLKYINIKLSLFLIDIGHVNVYIIKIKIPGCRLNFYVIKYTILFLILLNEIQISGYVSLLDPLLFYGHIRNKCCLCSLGIYPSCHLLSTASGSRINKKDILYNNWF